VAWLILPWVVAFLTVPAYSGILTTTPTRVMASSFGLGFLYGTGGLAFGVAIRYIGFSLTYTLAIGISATLGTIMPLFWTPVGGFDYQLNTLFDSNSGLLVLLGLVLALVGIAVCGYAGVLRESTAAPAEGLAARFDFRRGVPLAILAGILSAVFNFALLAGEPLAEAARAGGASQLLSWNAIYPFSHGGAWAINLIWCVWLIRKNATVRQFVRLDGDGHGRLSFYYLMALLSGTFWYFQFFFYGMGHQKLGERFSFTSWALHMSMLILFSNIYGKVFREWDGASRRPRRLVHLGMLLIVIATLIITYGNHLGDRS